LYDRLSALHTEAGVRMKRCHTTRRRISEDRSLITITHYTAWLPSKNAYRYHNLCIISGRYTLPGFRHWTNRKNEQLMLKT